ncbi:MAG: NAD-dependent epimerase/dehydratase family protein [Ignavibacteriales bacterium]|nr:NAD-dependent epimerase/dehydratase family protein [Ignavibacteriales bacterium]
MDRVKVVITGGAGFIGSHIAEYWMKENASVHIIDDLRSGFKRNIPQSSFVKFYQGSITDKKLVEKVVEGADYIFNLAALVSVPESIIKPKECIEINVIGLLNILDAAKAAGVKKVVHSSSAAVYGDNSESPKFIFMKPQPKTPYGITKLDGEYYCQMYFENFGLRTTSLRYFNVFGPRQDPKSQYAAAIPIFINKALKNDPIEIFGDGEQTRDFVFVKDVVFANVLAAQNEIFNGTLNIANGSSISILEIAKLIIKETNSKSKIVFKSERPGDIKHSLASIKDTAEILNFVPKVDLMQGLKETIRYFLQATS